MVAALPLGGVGIPEHQAALAIVRKLVPRVELARRAALDHVRFLQQARLELVPAMSTGGAGDAAVEPAIGEESS